MINFGLIANKTSGPIPQRSSVPGRKFSIKTSDCLINSFRISPPAGLPKSRASVFLFRANMVHQSGTPSLECPCKRTGSPLVGCSILITSAPKSANIVAAIGPANKVAASSTRIPFNALKLGTDTFRLQFRQSCHFLEHDYRGQMCQ